MREYSRSNRPEVFLGKGVLRKIYTALDGCFWYRLFSALSSSTMIEASERRKAKESILMSRKLNERQKIFTNIFMTLLKGGRGGEGEGEKQNVI